MKNGLLGIGISAWLLLALSTAPLRSHAQTRQPHDAIANDSASSREPRLHPAALKLGWMGGDANGGFFDLSFEQSLKRRLSVQIDLGLFPFLRGNRQIYGSYLGLHIGLSGRYYFAWSRSAIDGIHIGPTIGLCDATYFQPTSHKRKLVLLWPQFGAVAGIQKSLWGHLLLGADLKVGYAGHIQSRSYNVDGNYTGGYDHKQLLTSLYLVTVGYRF